MVLRIIGSIAVIAGCTGIGMFYAARDGFRVNELLEFKKALNILSSEMEYKRAPLHIACANIAKRTASVASKLFNSFASMLTAGAHDTAYNLWQAAILEAKGEHFLTKEDISVIDDLGKTLGYLDMQLQQNAIAYTIDYIDSKTTELQTRNEKNKRMYRSLGMICGMLITVLLW